MPEQIEAYACDKCGTVYQGPAAYSEASGCEMNSVTFLDGEEELQLDQEISFQAENQGMGRWSYSGNGGKIVDKQIVKTDDGSHRYIYWVFNEKQLKNSSIDMLVLENAIGSPRGLLRGVMYADGHWFSAYDWQKEMISDLLEKLKESKGS